MPRTRYTPRVLAFQRAVVAHLPQWQQGCTKRTREDTTQGVSSVRDAIDRLRTIQPDALVSDIGLPDEDGYALIREIRRQEQEHGGYLPAVALTGFTRAEDRARVLAAGFQAHITKPVEPGELTAAIAALTQLPTSRAGPQP
jgi:CheY-like chemotaxis protein